MDYDLNLIEALDALLTESSVTKAAERLHTSAPAMSRTLARLRRAFDDPLLVRAGRDLVPTPRALELRGEVHAVAARARALFGPSTAADPRTAVRRFDLQVTDMLSTTVIPSLIDDLRAQAPGISLRLRPETLQDTPALREGLVDLEIGTLGPGDPEIHSETLVTETLVGAIRPDHPLAKVKTVTAKRFAAADHIVVSRRGRAHGPIDERLAELGLSRRVIAVLPSFAGALQVARGTDVVCVTPAKLGRPMLETLGLRTFPIPVAVPEVVLGMAWHPRNHHDRTHALLRERVRRIMAAAAG
ncbi:MULTISPECIES: LysR family transcriptional regulator [unclassified Amycolatopsis]|uniref:LysR family transcriptional regulator n=1 Tax=unclassified Amycolatopsis TaxID=2618356 RepID=UPI0028753F33|nr:MULTISPECIES: LysR family transcriptional regulator [unclassified Amycolatopsis]MDS0134607.1 LysR family transcriptional regulator [Amycolatopsis sp. 505]MDS0147494.1 LysR family transcriptional regulator [Amycolatopsis sp. CM201R]